MLINFLCPKIWRFHFANSTIPSFAYELLNIGLKFETCTQLILQFLTFLSSRSKVSAANFPNFPQLYSHPPENVADQMEFKFSNFQSHCHQLRITTYPIILSNRGNITLAKWLNQQRAKEHRKRSVKVRRCLCSRRMHIHFSTALSSALDETFSLPMVEGIGSSINCTLLFVLRFLAFVSLLDEFDSSWL